jgi:GWxTD domain-containing protein
MTVMGMVKQKNKTSALADYPLNLYGFSDETISLGGPEYLWSVDRVGNRVVYHPNPARVYGLYNDSLRVYLEVYAPDSLAAQGNIQLQAVVLNEKGEMVKEAAIPLPRFEPPERPGAPAEQHAVTYPILIREDINILPAGRYSLYINAGFQDQLLFRMRCGGFSVAWDMRSWEMSRKNLLAEANFLLDDTEFDAFEKKSTGEQELMLRKLWKELDPNPYTGINEAYESFLDRLGYVNANYADYQSGSFTDRGLIYLKFGRPDEVIVDVIPLNRESISDALEKIHNKYHAVNFSNTGARIGYANPARIPNSDPRRIGVVGEGGEVAYPYELWIYNGKGDAILKKDKVLEPDLGLRFIFIDREGFGRYKLESSSSMANK